MSDGDAEEGLTPEKILDFSANVIPAPLPEALRQALQDFVQCLSHPPDPEARQLRHRAAEVYGVSPDEVSVGNGVGEFLYAIPRGLRPRRVVMPAPCCTDYWRASDYAGAESEGVLSSEAKEFALDPTQIEMRLSGTDMVFLGNPNDPTGVAAPADAIRALAQKFSGVTFVVDESFVEFVPEAFDASLLGAPLPANIIVLRSPAAIYGLAGLRLAFLFAGRTLIEQVQAAREPNTVGEPALRAGEALLAGAQQEAPALRQAVIAERERVRDELSRMAGIRVFRSQANFLLLKTTRPGLNALQLCERLLKQRVLIRNVAGYRGLDGRFARVSVRSGADNDRLLAAFSEALDESKWK
jgi:histidinol-phosphate/aromatic aminotransferase/cobyric acid decarboxylase-like protein